MPLSDSTLYIWWPQPSLKESCNILLKWSNLYIMTSSVALTLTKLVLHFDLVVQIRWLKVVIAEKKLYNFQSLIPKIWWPYVFWKRNIYRDQLLYKTSRKKSDLTASIKHIFRFSKLEFRFKIQKSRKSTTLIL